MLRWFRRRSRAGDARSDVRRQRASEDLAHLTEFARTRRGVEGFVEPRTTVTETTLLLVAHDGEWTRRRVPSAAKAHEFANKHGIPSYDAQVVGYPQRMRAWNARRAEAEKNRLGPTTPGEKGS
ncbi:hypothetical protein [Actinopolymorpha pittospori]|uniref:Uncharacterized protein n=1 Tax=Actinopolymorpha pittospori TaxID=648752 RepID=A0A927RPB4_9ACTN|nr:hypothetical protein [Actinopolymorpha pittospori]MBE1610953.1 hypothetical protein [Actinopolymorpha pittospori]